MEKELHIHNPTQDIIIRTGSAMPVKEPVAIRLEGDINAPKEFYNKRKVLFASNIPDYSIDASNVVINKNEGKVTLTIDENSPYYGVVTGRLRLNPLLKNLRINDEGFQGFTTAELAKALRMNRMYFSDPEFFNKLVNKLQNFKAQFETQLEASDDKRGNIAHSVVKKMTSEHSYNFALFLPVYEGTEDVNVPIEVDIAYSGDSTIRCQLISVELVELQKSIKESLIDEYVVLFKDFPVIIQ